MMKRDYQCSRFTGIGCENHNENEQARKKNITLLFKTLSGWSWRCWKSHGKSLEEGPGVRGSGLAVGGSAWMSMREIAEMKCAGQSPGGCREGGDEGELSAAGICFFYTWVPLVGTSGSMASGAPLGGSSKRVKCLWDSTSFHRWSPWTPTPATISFK